MSDSKKTNESPKLNFSIGSDRSLISADGDQPDSQLASIGSCDFSSYGSGGDSNLPTRDLSKLQLTDFSWPEEAAKKTKFYFPELSNGDVKVSSSSATTHSFSYHLTYNSKKGIFSVESSETNEKVDLIHPEDIIGAELEIKFPTPSSKQGEETIGYHNKDKAVEGVRKMEKREEELGKHLLLSGNLNDFEEKNEDHSKSEAYLNIYCYPRTIKPPSLLSRIKSCALKNKHNSISDKIQAAPNNTENSRSQKSDDMSRYGNRYENHRRLKLYPTEDFSNVLQIVKAIRKIAKLGQFKEVVQVDNEGKKNENVTKRQKYLVVVNPFSGKKTGNSVYDTVVSKMLRECGVEHDVVVTKYAGHASQLMRKVDEQDEENVMDIANYDAIIALGGDGILSELLQGLRTRDDYEATLQRIKFGIVGCGTCNGLAASLLHASKEKYDVLESTFLLCKGQSSKCDMATYQTMNKSYTGFLTLSWAMIANIDIDSECLRQLGALRNDVWGAWSIVKMKSYKAKLSFLPVDKNYVEGEFEYPDINDDVPSNWTTIEDDIILFWASQVTHSAYNVLQSPRSRLNDGVFRLWIIRYARMNLTLKFCSLIVYYVETVFRCSNTLYT